RAGAAAGGGDRQLCRHLAGAPDPDRAFLPHRLCADVPDLDRTDPRGAGRDVANVSRRGAAMHETGWCRARFSALVRRAGLPLSPLAAPPPPAPSPPAMPTIPAPVFFLLPFPAIIALGLGKGGFAGIGMISTPLLALVVPPLQAAAILLPILLIQDVISCWAYRREWSAWNLKVLLPGSVVGVAAAGLFAAHVPNAYVEIAVGSTGVCFVLYTFIARVPKEPQQPSAAAGMFWGSLAGFTSTIIQVGAPPYQVYILPQRLDKLTLIGTTIIFFA